MNEWPRYVGECYLGKFTFFQTRQSLLMLPSGWFKCWRGEARGGVCQIYYMLEKKILFKDVAVCCVCVYLNKRNQLFHSTR